MEYKYSISETVAAQTIITSRLDNDIKTNLNLSSAVYIGVVKKGDDLYILFDKSIETSEKTSLDNIVQTHTPVALLTKTRNIPFYPNPKDIAETFYVSTGSFIYSGDSVLTGIKEIEIISMMSPGAISYDIQIVNRKNNTIIAEQNFTNTSLTLNKFTTINTNNIPISQTAIEVLVKINKTGNANKVVHIDQIVFWLD